MKGTKRGVAVYRELIQKLREHNELRIETGNYAYVRTAEWQLCAYELCSYDNIESASSAMRLMETAISDVSACKAMTMFFKMIGIEVETTINDDNFMEIRQLSGKPVKTSDLAYKYWDYVLSGETSDELPITTKREVALRVLQTFSTFKTKDMVEHLLGKKLPFTVVGSGKYAMVDEEGKATPTVYSDGFVGMPTFGWEEGVDMVIKAKMYDELIAKTAEWLEGMA